MIRMLAAAVMAPLLLAGSFLAVPVLSIGGGAVSPVAIPFGGDCAEVVDNPDFRMSGDPRIYNQPGYRVRPHVHAAGQVLRSLGFRYGLGGADAHNWNPRSDHPLGLALDLNTPTMGRFPSAAVKAELDGWNRWLIANRDALAVKYTIWYGMYYSPATNWQGRPYGGGNVYDPRSATGGHFDHIHASFTASPGTGPLVWC